MFRRVCDVLNEYEAELVVSPSWWMKDMRTVSMEIRQGDKPRPLQGANEANEVSKEKSHSSERTHVSERSMMVLPWFPRRLHTSTIRTYLTYQPIAHRRRCPWRASGPD